MKNFVFVIVGVLFSAMMGITFSAYALSSQDDLTKEILKEAGITKTYSSDTKELKNLGNDDELPFNNLYLFTYQNVLDAPKDNAIKELAKLTRYSEDDLDKIISNGDITPITNRKTEQEIKAQSENVDEIIASEESNKASADEELEAFISANDFSATTEAFIRDYYAKYARPTDDTSANLNAVLTQEVIVDEYSAIVDAYQEEVAFQRDNRKLGYEALAGEMFVNNDLSDSANIDLLNDLDMIHYVLFGDYIVYPDRSSGDSVDLASISEANYQDDSIDEDFTSSTDVVLAEDTVSPYACNNDDELSDAITTFEETPESTDTVSPGSRFDFDVIFPWRDGLFGGASGTDEDSTTDTVTAVQKSLEELDDFISQLEGTKGDYSRSLPCGDIFCITVDLITETDDPAVDRDYSESDDCITCHLTFINKHMTETLSHSLVPGKLSMNWFEDATCKQAGTFVNLDFNVYTVKKPIDLDTGDDIDDAPKEDTDNLKELLTFEGFPLPFGADNTYEKTLAEMTCQSIMNLYEIAGSETTLEGVQARCAEASEEIASRKEEAYTKFEFEADIENQNTMYSQVSAELYTMLSYFEEFKTALEASYVTEQAPLKSLTTKKYCE